MQASCESHQSLSVDKDFTIRCGFHGSRDTEESSSLSYDLTWPLVTALTNLCSDCTAANPSDACRWCHEIQLATCLSIETCGNVPCCVHKCVCLVFE